MSRDLPKISIITPSLNQGKFIERTILSVFAQNYRNLEYIIIDGGSEDNSVEIIRNYADRLAYWCSELDNGQAHAINKGLRLATGDIVAYLSSDDQYLPGALDTVAETFARFPKKNWLAGTCRYHRLEGSEYTWVPEPPPEDRVALVRGPWGVPQPANFWRRELFSKYGLFREKLNYAMDTEFQVRLALAGEMPIVIKNDLAYSVLHPDCKTVKAQHMQLLEHLSFIDFFWDRLTPEEQIRAAIERCFHASDAATIRGAAFRYRCALYLGDLIKAFAISPTLTLRRLRTTLQKRFAQSG